MTSAPLAAITGGTGFVGLHLVPALARAGFRLRLLTRHAPSHPALANIGFEAVRGDLHDEKALTQLVSGADIVIHAAGLIKAHSRAEFLHTNQNGTLRLAQTTRRKAPDARFMLISSLAAREPQLSPYAFSKKAAEDAARQAYHEAREQLAILRPPAIYGSWDKETLALFKASLRPFVPILSTGKAALIAADDAAEAMSALAGSHFRAGCFALADEHPEGYQMRDILMAASQATGGAPRFFQLPASVLRIAGAASGLIGKTRRVAPIFTLGKAREILHPDWSVSTQELLPREIYAPRIGLTEGFAQTVAWYRQAGWLRG